MSVPVSFLVPTKDEAKNLPRCLESISWAGQVVVVDSQSSDQTPEIAEGHGAEVVQFFYSGKYPKKKNWALAAAILMMKMKVMIDGAYN